MACRFLDSFDNYDTTHALEKWTGIGPGASVSHVISTTSQRTGRACGQFTSGADSFKTVDSLTTWIIGGAFLWTGYGGGVRIGNADPNSPQVYWQIQNDGTIVVLNGAGGTLGTTTATASISLNNYYYIEMKATIGASGSVVIRINGQTVLNTTGRTNNGGTGTVGDCIFVLGPGGGGGVFMLVDDFYVFDTSGGHNNDFAGDSTISVIVPVSDSGTIQWATSSGTAHWSLVDEVPPDDDTTYVQSTMTGTSTTGPTDLYNFQTVASTLSIIAVQSNMFARKTDAGDRAISLVTHNSGVSTNADPTGRYLNLTYLDYLNQFDTDPVSGGTWTPAIVNATEWGVEVVV